MSVKGRGHKIIIKNNIFRVSKREYFDAKLAV